MLCHVPTGYKPLDTTPEDIKTMMMIMLIVEHSVSTDKSCPVVKRTQQKHNKAIRDIKKKRGEV